MVAHCCAKYAIFIPNVVLFIAAVAVTCFGAWMIVDKPDWIPGGEAMANGFAIAVTVVGGVTTVVSFLGCCGAATNNRCALGIFFFTTLALFGIVLAGGIVGIVHEDWLKGGMRRVMKSEIDKPVGYDGLLVYAHAHFNCCGIEDLPKGCDIDYPPKLNCTKGSIQCQHGCLQPVWDSYVAPNLKTAVGILIGLAAVLAIASGLSLCLCCAVGGHGSNHGHYGPMWDYYD